MKFAVRVILLLLQLLIDIIGVVAYSAIIVPDAGFDKLKESYISVTEQLTWVQASDVCKNVYGGHIAGIRTEEEQTKLAAFVSQESVDNHFWISLQQSNGQIVWNDGSCNEVNFNWNNWKNGDTASHGIHSSEKCYVAHDTKYLQWERAKCGDSKHFVCQTKMNIRHHKIKFHTLTKPGSDGSTISTLGDCETLCKGLDQCFIASLIPGACVVGLASDTADTVIISVTGDTTVTSATSSSSGTNNPPDCVTTTAPPIVLTTLDNYTMVNGHWKPQSVTTPSPVSCPPTPSPVVSQELVTQTHTVTEVSVLVSTVASPVEVYTCTDQPPGNTVIVETTTAVITQVQTSVVMATTTIPTYVTVTADAASPSSCMPSVIVNPCSSATHLPISPSSTVAQATASIQVVSTSSGGMVSSGGGSPSTPNLSSDADHLRDQIYEDLHVDPEELSKTRRSKNSENNKLVSSVAMGFSFSLMCLLFIAVIILSDMKAVWEHIRTRMCVNLRHFARS